MVVINKWYDIANTININTESVSCLKMKIY